MERDLFTCPVCKADQYESSKKGKLAKHKDQNGKLCAGSGIALKDIKGERLYQK